MPENTDSMNQDTTMEDPTMPRVQTAPSTSSTGTIKEFSVEASSFKFVPKTMTVKKGDTVKIIVTNAGGVHDFRIDEFNAHTKTLSAGQSEMVTFAANKSGTFEYYCSIGNHRAMGMVGTLVVE